MKLSAAEDVNYLNLAVIRRVLEEMGGNEEVEFGNGAGSGVLHWHHRDGTRYHMHTAIPLHWLAEPAKSDRVSDATRHFASGVRFASTRVERPGLKWDPFARG